MNNVKTAALMATLGAILVVVGGVLGGQSGAAFALVIAVGINFSMYFWSDKIIAGMITIGIIGLAIDGVMGRISARLLRWHRGLEG